MNEQNGTMVVRGEAGIEREGFGTHEMERRGEARSTALAAGAQAEVQARYIMALQRPRSVYDARARMLAECKRPGFAMVAIFRKPIGGNNTAEGLSIRFAEVAARAWGNLHVGREVITDDGTKRVMRVHVTDLEANLTESLDIVIDKTVERNSLKEGQVPRGRRVNSYGKQVYIVDASEGELLTKQRAEEAKAKRTCVLAMIPGDVLDECKALVYRTRADEDARDPEAAKKNLFDSFAAIGVKPSDLEAYVGHALDTLSPPELGDLRGIYTAISDGIVTWPEALFAKTGSGGDKPDPKAEATKAKIKANLDKKRQAKDGSKKPPAEQPRNNGDRRAAIAEQAGVTPEAVAEIEKYAGESLDLAHRAARSQGHDVTFEQVNAVLAALKAGT